MATQAQIEQYRRAQKKIEQALRRELAEIFGTVNGLPVDEARMILRQVMPELIDKYGLMSSSVAAEWFEELTGEKGWVPDSFRREAFESSVGWASKHLLDETAGSTATMLALASVVEKHVKQYARDTISNSADRHTWISYARRIVGDTCDFCVLLASRGPVYGSLEDAGGEGNSYHNDCDCIPVPVRGAWTKDPSTTRGYRWDGESPGYDFEKLYETEYQPYWRPPGGQDRAATMRQRYADQGLTEIHADDKHERYYDSLRDVLARKRDARSKGS